MPASPTIALTEILARSAAPNSRCPASSSALRPGSGDLTGPDFALTAAGQHFAVLLAHVDHTGELIGDPSLVGRREVLLEQPVPDDLHNPSSDEHGGADSRLGEYQREAGRAYGCAAGMRRPYPLRSVLRSLVGHLVREGRFERRG